MTLRVTSADGTRIAYDRKGTGPAVILVGGTLDDGAENAPLARLLANHFTVYNYARRGRGASGNTPPYAVAREVEDLDALIATAGGSAHVYGASSGGALALEAKMDRARVSLGEPVTIKLVITGAGNLRKLAAPELPLPGIAASTAPVATVSVQPCSMSPLLPSKTSCA